MTLTEFLLARIAEDEAVAKAAHPSSGDDTWILWVCDEFMHVATGEDRVLAECEAKRRIVAEHSEGVSGECGTCVGEWGNYHVGEPATGKAWPCPTLRILAQPHADHPDYREEWKP